MQSECFRIRKELKSILKRQRFRNDIDSRIKSLCSLLLRFQDSLINIDWVQDVFDLYRQLINSYLASDSQTLLSIIQNLEDNIISNLVINLKIPQRNFNQLLQQSRNESSNQSLVFILPKFLSLTINNPSSYSSISNRNNLSTFIDFWTIKMEAILYLFKYLLMTLENVQQKRHCAVIL